MGCHGLLQEIFLTQGSNLGLRNCSRFCYLLSHQGNSPSLYVERYICVCICTVALGACCCAGSPLDALLGLLIAVASLVAARGLRCLSSGHCGPQALQHRLSRCGTVTSSPHSMWDLAAPGTEPVSLALASRFLFIMPPGKPSECVLSE